MQVVMFGATMLLQKAKRDLGQLPEPAARWRVLEEAANVLKTMVDSSRWPCSESGARGLLCSSMVGDVCQGPPHPLFTQ
jgi:hypothetical protein